MAQTFPTRPVRFILPLAPGSERDLLASLLSEQLTQSWRHTVKVDHRPDGPTGAGSAQVAQAYADGYTLLLATPMHTIRPALGARGTFDAARDFLPVTQLASMPLTLVVPSSLPATTPGELVDLARARPGELTLGSAAGADVAHLAGAMFVRMAGVKLQSARVRAPATLTGELAANRISVALVRLPAVSAELHAGRLRALAVGSAQRTTLLREVPTLAESGLPDFEASDWTGVLAPARTPGGVIARLHADLAAFVHLQDVRDRLLAAGFEPVGNSQRSFAESLGTEFGRWARVVRESGIRPD